ncbi:peptidase M28-like protein [Geodermatophilus tzadiensis]|uniref:Peptidase M28-like protein n=1 Tax=Geodermatophilus tzadiensis TaxID=1137988 RepID=A0A2T0TYF7_9ACTN|nr:M20/M25/M40 family metallo-hydrolase [Geodermatophilus tzadiensis]PRY50568.1 peptidase M28-like protein [Geodermatophilus tzadiensis]
MPAARPPVPERGLLAPLLALALLAGLAAWSVLALQPPSPAPADAPAPSFSAARAFEHVERFAAETHVAGSDAHQRVVDGLVSTLTGLGLDTRVQNAVGTWQSGPGAAEMARVRNVVAVLPGTEPTGRLFLVAHTDSVETGPGASDDTAGVAALLETVRALGEGEPLRNDVVVVLTDAEEACLCGAEAFAASHPLAPQGGVVLNLEARGTTGPPITFETSQGNAGLAARYAAAAPHPVASSFAVEVYRTLPNDTDFSVLLARGFTGLNTAFIDGNAAYHTPQDTPSRLDRGTLQALGDNTLALTRELGDADLTDLARPGDGDATYFPLLSGLARYPGWLVWPLAGAAVLGVVALAVVDRRRGSPLPRTLLGAAAAVVPLVLAPLGVVGLWRLLVLVRPGYASMIDPWRPGWFRLAAVAVVLLVVLAWYALLRRRLGAPALRTGALALLAVLAAVLAAMAPGGSYLAALPALAGVLAGLLPGSSRPLRLAGGVVAGTVAVVVLAPTVALFFPALGLAGGAAPAAVTTLLVLALLPVVEELFPAGPGRLRALAVPGVAAVLVVALTVVGIAVDRFDQQHPVPSQLVYALEADTGEAWWASTEAQPGEYTARYVGTPRTLPHDYPYLAGRAVAVGQAEPAGLPPSTVQVLEDRVADGRRTVTVRVRPQRDVRLVVLDLRTDGGRVVGARAEARDVPDDALGEDRLWLTFHAPPAAGVEATVTVDGDGPLTLRAVDGSDGLSGLPGFEPRPPGVDAAGTHSSDLVVVGATTELG